MRCAICGEIRTLREDQGELRCVDCYGSYANERADHLHACHDCGVGITDDEAFFANPDTGELRGPNPDFDTEAFCEDCWLSIAPEQE